MYAMVLDLVVRVLAMVASNRVPRDKLLPLPQPPVRARTDARTNPSAQRVCTLSQFRTKLLLLSHNFSNVMINNTSTNEAH
jgi:hypothetical protein